MLESPEYFDGRNRMKIWEESGRLFKKGVKTDILCGYRESYENCMLILLSFSKSFFVFVPVRLLLTSKVQVYHFAGDIHLVHRSFYEMKMQYYFQNHYQNYLTVNIRKQCGLTCFSNSKCSLFLLTNRSLYRELMFLSLAACGTDNIDVSK